MIKQNVEKHKITEQQLIDNDISDIRKILHKLHDNLTEIEEDQLNIIKTITKIKLDNDTGFADIRGQVMSHWRLSLFISVIAVTAVIGRMFFY